MVQRTFNTCHVEQLSRIFALTLHLSNYLVYGCLDGGGIEQSIVLSGRTQGCHYSITLFNNMILRCIQSSL
jgi:hypothetical protein